MPRTAPSPPPSLPRRRVELPAVSFNSSVSHCLAGPDDVFNTLGATATPMPFTEVFTALESKAIDGPDVVEQVLGELETDRAAAR